MKKSERKVLSLSEEIEIIKNGKSKKVKAKIDTGADKSSIDTSLAAELKLGPIVKKSLIKSASGNLVRPVLKVKVKIHGHEMEHEFNLAERTHLKYSVLIGKNVLKKGKFLVDPLK